MLCTQCVYGLFFTFFLYPLLPRLFQLLLRLSEHPLRASQLPLRPSQLPLRPSLLPVKGSQLRRGPSQPSYRVISLNCGI